MTTCVRRTAPDGASGQAPLAKPQLQHRDVVGTPAGFRWHRRRGEDACDECTAANSRSVQAWRDRLRPDHLVRVPLDLLGQLLAAVPAEERQVFEDRLGDLAERAARVTAGARG